MPEVVEPTRGAMSWERGWSWSTLCMAWSPSGRFRDILLLVLKGVFVHHGYNDKWYFTLYTLTSVCIFSLLGEFVRMNGEGLMLESSTLKLFMVA